MDFQGEYGLASVYGWQLTEGIIMGTLYGLWQLPWWGYLLVTLFLTHITIAAVTLYLHRHQAHRAIDLHPLISHFFRFWLWLTTAMVTREWVAVHRKHHARVETVDDPHSPQIKGIKAVLVTGAELYKQETARPETLESYGHETPDDWMEKNLYSNKLCRDVGVALMLLVNFYLFGFIGITIWAVQMAWIPFFAAGVINGVGHWGGYRNFDSPDASTNIVPWGLLIGGEELHNNHHAFASSAKFSSHWWEFDLGWFYIRCLEIFNMANVKKIAPTLTLDYQKPEIDHDTVRAVITNRFHIMSRYLRIVVKRVYKQESRNANINTRKLLKSCRRWIARPQVIPNDVDRNRMEELLDQNRTIQMVHEFGQRLHELWNEKTATHDHLLKTLRELCEQAEASGIEALEEFSQILRSCTLKPVYAR